jgi:hypothetical protein
VVDSVAMTRAVLAAWIALTCTACAGPRASAGLQWGANLPQLEGQIRESDGFDLRCIVASQYLALVHYPDLPDLTARQYAARARVHADAAIRLHDDRVQGHYYRAVAIGHILARSTLPDLDLIDELDAAGQRARELDPGFDGAGPLRLLAILYWRAPQWPAGPANARDHELIEELFAEAIERAPTCAENHIAYAEYLLTRDLRDAAVERTVRARAVLPADTVASPFEKPDLLKRVEALEAALGLRR